LYSFGLCEAVQTTPPLHFKYLIAKLNSGVGRRLSNKKTLIPLAAKYTISLLPTEVNNITQNVDTIFTINKRFSVPQTGKVYIVAVSTNDSIGSNNIIIQPMNFAFDVVKDV
jgi:hypothetical protein